MQIQFYKRILSYLYPVLIQNKSSDINPVLKLYLCRNQFQLATADALYSDGKDYRPLREGYKKIKERLPAIKETLVLGTGLGSAIHILDDMGFYPHCTLVDLDNTVLKMAMELMPASFANKLTPICEDAFRFIEGNTRHFDLLILDVFIGRKVPAFVTTESYLRKCGNAIQKDGILIFNYIAENETLFSQVNNMVTACFKDVTLVEFGINKVFIASNT